MKRFTIVLALFAHFNLMSQISIDFPFNRAVYQRNIYNVAEIKFAGTFSQQVNLIEARILLASNGNVVVNWTTLQTNPTNGTFRGLINNVPPGWYRAEIRGVLTNGSFSNTVIIQKFGVGEVFVIAGQSNAQGVSGSYGANGATDDRINTVNFLDICEVRTPNFPVYSQLNGSSNVATYGHGPWAYGKLGDLISQNLNVPVLFLNAGCSGSTITNWYESMQGLPTTHLFTCQQYCNKVGTPYGVLKEILKFYIPHLGIRAVLWHQGEGDNFSSYCVPSLPSYPSAADYRNKLEAIITQSRNEISSNIPWVVSRVSYFPIDNLAFPTNDAIPSDDYYDGTTNTFWKGTRQEVINGQNEVIYRSGGLPYIYAGPFTDNIARDPSLDAIHFANTNQNSGLDQLGTAWYNSLIGNGLFSANTQINHTQYPNLDLTCQSGNFIGVAQAGFASYTWVENENNITSPFNAVSTNVNASLLPNNSYRVYMKTADNRVFLSNKITVPNTAIPSAPLVSSSTLQTIFGNQITLTATGCTGNVSWQIQNSTSNNTSTLINTNPLVITMSETTNFYAQCTTFQQCTSATSSLITVIVCPNLLNITSTIIGGTFIYEANDKITAVNQITNGSNVTYDAKNAVILNPGFSVQVGGVFQTKIDGCGNN
jgi:Carbohydrate esterase, sialic acid-specific acetylesterase